MICSAETARIARKAQPRLRRHRRRSSTPRRRIGVFIGNVKVVDPQFTLTSDRLTVHLNKDEEGGGLNDAEADGNVVIVHVNQPKTPARQAPNPGGPRRRPSPQHPVQPVLRAQQPVTSTGKAEKALYEAKDGSITLTGWPQVTQGANTHVATAPGVKMVLYKDGRMQTYGSTRTLIVDRTATGSPIRMAPTRLEIESPFVETKRHVDKPILRTDKLVKIYGGRSVVNGIDIHVNEGEIVGLLGPNGAGKTTTFYLIVGLVRPNGGRVYFQDRDVTGFAMHRRARMGMGYLPQEESIFRKLTVEQNIMAILETLRVSRRERVRRCDELLRQFGIDNLAKNQALTLSGGEKRRLTIARSLVTSPKLMMLDEPFSGVDPIAVSEIQQHISNLRKSGLAILITDHNVRETLEIVDRAYLIFDGRVESQGTREFLINDPISRQLYLGERFRM